VTATPTIGNFYAAPARVRANTATTLYWLINNFQANTCTISAAPSSALTSPYNVAAASSSVSTNNITQTTVFTLNCGAGITQQKTVTLVPTFQEI
jgi:hypothetical protein